MELFVLTKLRLIKKNTGAKWKTVIKAAFVTSSKGRISIRAAIRWINLRRINLN